MNLMVHVSDTLFRFYAHIQECGNSEPTAGHFGLFSPLLSCSPYTLCTVQFQYTRHSLDYWKMSCMTGCFHTTGHKNYMYD